MSISGEDVEQDNVAAVVDQTYSFRKLEEYAADALIN